MAPGDVSWDMLRQGHVARWRAHLPTQPAKTLCAIGSSQRTSMARSFLWILIPLPTRLRHTPMQSTTTTSPPGFATPRSITSSLTVSHPVPGAIGCNRQRSTASTAPFVVSSGVFPTWSNSVSPVFGSRLSLVLAVTSCRSDQKGGVGLQISDTVPSSERCTIPKSVRRRMTPRSAGRCGATRSVFFPSRTSARAPSISRHWIAKRLRGPSAS